MKNATRGVAVALALGFAVACVHFADAQDKKEKPKPAAAAAAKFEVYKDKGGKYRFRFYDAEGDEIAMSVHGYEKKADVQKLVDAMKREVPKAKVEDAESK